MLRFLPVAVVAALGLIAAVPVHSQKKDKDAPTVHISWHGQSFFQIKSSKGTNLVIDPHQIDVYGRYTVAKADAVLCSHFHDDHTQIGVIEDVGKLLKDKSLKLIIGLKGSPRNPEWNLVDETVKDIRIRTVGAYHDDMQGMKYGKTGIFCIEVDGWKIVHLGDLGHLLTADQIKKIGTVDVLMIPVGGIYTINGSEAKKVVAQLKPKEFIFPMHCGTKIYDELLAPTEFLDEFPKANVTSSDDNKILLHDQRKTEQRPRPTVVQLHYWPKGKKD